MMLYELAPSKCKSLAMEQKETKSYRLLSFDFGAIQRCVTIQQNIGIAVSQLTSRQNVAAISFDISCANHESCRSEKKVLIEHHFFSELHPNPIEMALAAKLTTLTSSECSTFHLFANFEHICCACEDYRANLVSKYYQRCAIT